MQRVIILKKRIIVYLIVFTGIISIQASCKSYTYSTCMNLPAEPLEKGDFEISGAFEVMPEARPDYTTHRIAPGGIGNIAVGVSDKVSLNLRVWFSDDMGFSIATHIIKPINESSRIYFSPRVGVVGIGVFNTEQGIGVGLNTTYHKSFNQNFALYSGLGLAYGQTDFLGGSGFGVLSNAGISYRYNKGFYVNFELNPIYQYSFLDVRGNFTMNPGVSLGAIIFNKEKRRRNKEKLNSN